jgi:PTS hybrid protein
MGFETPPRSLLEGTAPTSGAINHEEEQLVSLVLIAHSRLLGEGLLDMVEQVAGPTVRVAIAAGTLDGRLGTSAPLITDAIRSALAGGRAGPVDGVLVLLDLGSAALSFEIALADLTEAERSRVRVSEAPLVEGAVLAAVQASLGASLDEAFDAAAAAATMPKLPRG